MGRQIRNIELDKKHQRELRKMIRKAQDRRTADRLRVVLYKADGYTHQQIADLLQMGINQVTKVLNQYVAGGLEALYSKKKVPGFRAQTKRRTARDSLDGTESQDL